MIVNQGINSGLDGTIGHTIIDTNDQDMNIKPALLDATDTTKVDIEMPVATSSPNAKETGPIESDEVMTPVLSDNTITRKKWQNVTTRCNTKPPECYPW